MNELPLNLYNWAKTEMKFSPKPDCKYMLSPNDMKEICEGENANIWKYCIEHIFSLKTVQTVKDNLKIKNIQNKLKKCDNENITIDSINEQVMEEKQRDLTQNLLISESNIQYLQKSISQKEEKISKAEKNIKELTEKWKEMHYKYIFLDKYYKHLDDKIRSYQKSDDELCKKILSIRNKARNNNSKFDLEEQQICENEESSVTVKSTINFIENYLINSVRSESEIESIKFSSFQKLSDEIKYHIQNKVASQIITDLTNQSQENIVFISKFNDENYQLKNFPSRETINDGLSIQELLEGERLIHIRKYLECEKLNMDYLKFEEQFSALEAVLESQLKKYSLEKSVDIELLKKIITQEAELAGCTKSLEILKNSIKELEKDSCYLEKKKENLLIKYEKIQNFHKIVEKEKNIICSLLKQNLQMAVKIFSYQQEMHNFSESVLFSYNSQIDMLCQHLKNWISEEIYYFNNSKMSFLMTYFERNLPRLWENPEMKHIADLLDLKSHQAPEKLLYTSTNILMSNISYKDLANSVNQLLSSINEKIMMYTGENMKEINIKEQEGINQCTNLHKKVQKYLVYVEKGIKWIEEIKELMHIWWNQPGQFIPVDIKIDGRLLCHWLRLWSFTIHKLDTKSKS